MVCNFASEKDGDENDKSVRYICRDHDERSPEPKVQDEQDVLFCEELLVAAATSTTTTHTSSFV